MSGVWDGTDGGNVVSPNPDRQRVGGQRAIDTSHLNSCFHCLSTLFNWSPLLSSIKSGKWSPCQGTERHPYCHFDICDPLASHVPVLIIDFHSSGTTKTEGGPARSEHAGNDQSLSTQRHPPNSTKRKVEGNCRQSKRLLPDERDDDGKKTQDRWFVTARAVWRGKELAGSLSFVGDPGVGTPVMLRIPTARPDLAVPFVGVEPPGLYRWLFPAVGAAACALFMMFGIWVHHEDVRLLVSGELVRGRLVEQTLESESEEYGADWRVTFAYPTPTASTASPSCCRTATCPANAEDPSRRARTKMPVATSPLAAGLP